MRLLCGQVIALGPVIAFGWFSGVLGGCSVLFKDATGATVDAGIVGGTRPFGPPPFYVFVTSSAIGVPQLRGNNDHPDVAIKNADEICQGAADGANPGVGVSTLKGKLFRAFLEVDAFRSVYSEQNRVGLIRAHEGGWALSDGTLLTSAANPWPAFDAKSFGALLLNMDQHGNRVDADVTVDLPRMWRGLPIDNKERYSCKGWSSNVSTDRGSWVDARGNLGSETCEKRYRLICVQVAQSQGDAG